MHNVSLSVWGPHSDGFAPDVAQRVVWFVEQLRFRPWWVCSPTLKLLLVFGGGNQRGGSRMQRKNEFGVICHVRSVVSQMENIQGVRWESERERERGNYVVFFFFFFLVVIHWKNVSDHKQRWKLQTKRLSCKILLIQLFNPLMGSYAYGHVYKSDLVQFKEMNFIRVKSSNWGNKQSSFKTESHTLKFPRANLHIDNCHIFAAGSFWKA